MATKIFDARQNFRWAPKFSRHEKIFGAHQNFQFTSKFSMHTEIYLQEKKSVSGIQRNEAELLFMIFFELRNGMFQVA